MIFRGDVLCQYLARELVRKPIDHTLMQMTALLRNPTAVVHIRERDLINISSGEEDLTILCDARQEWNPLIRFLQLACADDRDHSPPFVQREQITHRGELDEVIMPVPVEVDGRPELRIDADAFEKCIVLAAAGVANCGRINQLLKLPMNTVWSALVTATTPNTFLAMLGEDPL